MKKEFLYIIIFMFLGVISISDINAQTRSEYSDVYKKLNRHHTKDSSYIQYCLFLSQYHLHKSIDSVRYFAKMAQQASHLNHDAHSKAKADIFLGVYHLDVLNSKRH